MTLRRSFIRAAKCRQRTLRCINCRTFLIIICALVVVECACVLAELMIDLQGIKFRFENEETEINRFVSYLRGKYPDVSITDDMRTMSDVINVLEKAIVLRSPKDLLMSGNSCVCNCPCNTSSTSKKINVTKHMFDSNKAPSQSFMQPKRSVAHGPTENTNLTQALPIFGDHNCRFRTLLRETLLPYEFQSFTESQVLSNSLKLNGLRDISLLSPPKSLPFSILLTESILPIPTFEGQTADYFLSTQLPFLQSSIQAAEVYSKNYFANLDGTTLNPNKLSFYALSTPVLQMIPSDIQQLAASSYFPPDIVIHSGVEMNSRNTHWTHSSMFNKDSKTPPLDTGQSGISTRVHYLQSIFPSRIIKRTVAFAWSSIETISRQSATYSSELVDNIQSLTYNNLNNKEYENMPSAFFIFPVINETCTISNVDMFSSIPPTQNQSTNKLSDAAVFKKKLRIGPTNMAQIHCHSITSGRILGNHFSSRKDRSFQSTAILENQQIMPVPLSAEASSIVNGSQIQKPLSLHDIFVLEINNVIDSFFLVAEFVPEHDSVNRTRFFQNNLEYSKIYKASKALHFISLSILSVMVLETAVKLFCTGWSFFKKKFEVFDAFIVISSFALDFVFLDSRWYETGKDATTILVLLLPWRVVRIVNSFLMTIKHKHHLKMMNMKRAKKKAELKSAKLQTLLSEIRKDVQLLVALCRSNEIDEKDITACLYGKGRRSVTLSAMSTCTSLVLISTLGKDAVQEDDIYGKLFKEALYEGDLSELDAEILQADEAAIDAAIEQDEQLEARRKSRKYKSKKAKVKRSYTVPRRSASVEIPELDIDENNSNIIYINDGYSNPQHTSRHADNIVMLHNGQDVNTISGAVAAGCSSVNEEDETLETDLPSSWTLAPLVLTPAKRNRTESVTRGNVKGVRSNSMVTFEVTTHVTYI